MATIPHALYCFESLVSTLNHSTPLRLDDIDTLWTGYKSHLSSSTTTTDNNTTAALPRRSSITDASTFYPLFVTWNTLSARGSRRRLRGCIGTFEAQALDTGLREYACTAALHDTRFRPISTSELPTLECGVTLLTDFETAASPLEWEVGTHGVRIAFLHKGRRYSATYLPSVAEEQGWSREETLTSLIRKAGCDGVRWDEAESLRVTRYQGRVTHVGYEEWRAWRNWVDATATKS